MRNTKADCNRCGKGRNHTVLHDEKCDWEDEDGINYQSGSDSYEMLKCCGCEAVTTRHTSMSSWELDENGEEVPRVLYYPPSVSRRQPPWMFDLFMALRTDEKELYDLLKEIYVSLDNSLLGVASMGVRAIIEYIMISKVGDKGSFARNLQAFQEDGYVSRMQRERLDTILEVGHAAMHRLYRPSSDSVNTLIDIMESLIETSFIHENKVSKLKGGIPPRKQNKQRGEK